MNRLQQTYEITLQLASVLDQDITPQNREAIIFEVHELIEARAVSMEQLQPPFSEEETKIGKALVTMNSTIQAQLEQLFSELKEEMRQVKKQKKSNRNYTNPYKSVQALDGMFLDSKQ